MDSFDTRWPCTSGFQPADALAYLDDGLPNPASSGFGPHLRTCEHCRQFVESCRAMEACIERESASIANVAEGAMMPADSERLAALRRSVWKSAPPRRRSGGLLAWGVGLAAAAALVLMVLLRRDTESTTPPHAVSVTRVDVATIRSDSLQVLDDHPALLSSRHRGDAETLRILPIDHHDAPALRLRLAEDDAFDLLLFVDDATLAAHASTWAAPALRIDASDDAGRPQRVTRLTEPARSWDIALFGRDRGSALDAIEAVSDAYRRSITLATPPPSAQPTTHSSAFRIEVAVPSRLRIVAWFGPGVADLVFPLDGSLDGWPLDAGSHVVPPLEPCFERLDDGGFAYASREAPNLFATSLDRWWRRRDGHITSLDVGLLPVPRALRLAVGARVILVVDEGERTSSFAAVLDRLRAVDHEDALDDAARDLSSRLRQVIVWPADD